MVERSETTAVRKVWRLRVGGISVEYGNGSESSVPAAYSAKSKAALALFLIREGGGQSGRAGRLDATEVCGGGQGWGERENGERVSEGGDDLTDGIAYVDR